MSRKLVTTAQEALGREPPQGAAPSEPVSVAAAAISSATLNSIVGLLGGLQATQP